MEDWQKRQLDEWHRRGYLPELIALARSYCAPLWWHDPRGDVGSAVRHNGTVVLVDTGSKLIGVTAEHVYQALLSDRATDGELVCQLGGITFEPTGRLIDSDAALDLVTFELSEILASGSLSNVWRPTSWPPTRIAAGELALVGGFPEGLRNERTGETDFLFPAFITRADSSSERNAGIILKLAQAHTSTAFKLPPGANLSGISGGPVFRVRDGELSPLELVGFIYEYADGMELVYATHAAMIRADGTLERP